MNKNFVLFSLLTVLFSTLLVHAEGIISEINQDPCLQVVENSVIKSASNRGASSKTNWVGEYICVATGLSGDCEINNITLLDAKDGVEDYSVQVKVFLPSSVRPRPQTEAFFSIRLTRLNNKCSVSEPSLENVVY